MSMRAIHPPAAAARDELEFAKWVRSVGNRLLLAGITVELVPMLTSDDALFLGVDASEDVARNIKRCLYN